MSLTKSGNSMRRRAFCERAPAAIRVSHERLFTLPAAAASASSKLRSMRNWSCQAGSQSVPIVFRALNIR